MLGRHALTTGGGYLVDYAFGDEIKVRDGDRIRPAGTPFLGACVGHGVKLGTRTWVGAGRAIPNGTVLVGDPDRVLLRPPESVDPRRTWTVRGGRLVPVGAEADAAPSETSAKRTPKKG